MPVVEQTAVVGLQVGIARLAGRLDMETTAADLPVLQAALAANPVGLVIDMGAVTFLSSAGLRMLITVHQAAENAGKKLAITRVSPLVRRTFGASRLEGAFRLFETEDAAIEGLRS